MQVLGASQVVHPGVGSCRVRNSLAGSRGVALASVPRLSLGAERVRECAWMKEGGGGQTEGFELSMQVLGASQVTPCSNKFN